MGPVRDKYSILRDAKRANIARKLRDGGADYKEIGDALGLHHTSARHLVKTGRTNNLHTRTT